MMQSANANALCGNPNRRKRRNFCKTQEANSYLYPVYSQEKMSMQLLLTIVKNSYQKEVRTTAIWKELCQASEGVCKLKSFPVRFTFEIILPSPYNFVLSTVHRR